MKCIICGDWFPDAMVTCPVKNGETPKVFPKELCDACADKSGAYRKAVPRSYPAAPVDGYLTLAGAIERRVLEEYRRSYAEALIASQRTDCVCTDEECAFLALHRRVSESQYHAALTLSNIRELLDSTRREVQRDFPEFRQKDGLHHIQKRWYWYNRMMENQKKIKEEPNET